MVKFTGLADLERRPGHIDFDLDDAGNLDLRNQAHVVAVRFVSNKSSMSVFIDFRMDEDPDRGVSFEFVDAEVLKVEPYLPRGIDPIYAFGLLMNIDHWRNVENGREGFSFETTALSVELYSSELRAHLLPASGFSLK
ncbi:hypothetical protein [Amycolatopsis granulosa]|uniref:hypothetical protein n=1 Tax=Amycolatopsis granulosa TaxID=185684 RepID=UPI00142158E6|nr:hypothetical protein [Amycolatopsis granulosa]NIH88266.1 hypothetical protein [Amycolatopsis granulosa]